MKDKQKVCSFTPLCEGDLWDGLRIAQNKCITWCKIDNQCMSAVWRRAPKPSALVTTRTDGEGGRWEGFRRESEKDTSWSIQYWYLMKTIRMLNYPTIKTKKILLKKQQKGWGLVPDWSRLRSWGKLDAVGGLPDWTWDSEKGQYWGRLAKLAVGSAD